MLTPDSNREGPPMIIPGNGPRGGEGGGGLLGISHARTHTHLHLRARAHALETHPRSHARARVNRKYREERARFSQDGVPTPGKDRPAVPRAEPPRSNRRSLRLRPPCAAREEILFARFPREQDFQPRGMLAQISVGPGAARRQPAPVSHLRAHAHTHAHTHGHARAHARTRPHERTRINIRAPWAGFAAR